MHTKKVVCWGLVVMVAALFTALPAAAADKSDAAGRAATWEKEYNAGNLDAVVALYSADGCRMPPNQETVHGSAAILAGLKAAKDQGLAKIKIVVTAAESDDNVGYAMGTYVLSKEDGGHLDHGKWMLASKKVNGTWKTTCDIYNSDKAMQMGMP
jgi:ketosteroid isomerase-like protein